MRFRSFSSKQIKSILEDYLDISKLKINPILKIEDLINSSNGSPNQLLENIEIWNHLSDDIRNPYAQTKGSLNQHSRKELAYPARSRSRGLSQGSRGRGCLLYTSPSPRD